MDGLRDGRVWVDHGRLIGELVLTAMPAAGDRLVPFETPDRTPCCAAH
jgi:hypothetical protein